MNKFLKISLFAYLFLLPSYLFQVTIWKSLSFPLLDFIATLFVLLTAINLPKLYSFCELKTLLLKKEIFPSLLIFTGFVLSYVFSLKTSDWQSGLGILKSFVLLPLLSAFCFTLLKQKHILSIKHLVIPLSISSGLLSLLGYLYALSEKLTYDGRLTLFFESPNQLAIYLSIGFICTLFIVKNSLFRKRSLGFLFILFSFSQVFCLYLTQSAGSLIGLCLTIPLLFIDSKTFCFYKKMLLLFVILSTILIFFTSSLLGLTQYSQSTPATSIDSRITIYSVSHQIIKDNYLLGVGPGNFQKVYLDYQKFFPPYPQWAVPHAHNNLLQFELEGGITAFVGFLLLFFFIYKTKKQAVPETLVFCVLLYLLIHGVFDVTIWKNDLSTIFWIFASLAVFKI